MPATIFDGVHVKAPVAESIVAPTGGDEPSGFVAARLYANVGEGIAASVAEAVSVSVPPSATD